MEFIPDQCFDLIIDKGKCAGEDTIQQPTPDCCFCLTLCLLLL